VAALREVGGHEPRLVRRTVAGSAVLLVGVTTLGLGLFSGISNPVAIVGAGAAIAFIGLTMLGPLVTRPLGHVLGSSLRWRGPIGRLAASNVTRNPRRTSATAAALMVGVAVVALMTVMAASIKSSVGSVVDSTMRADVVISSGTGQAGATGFSWTLQQRLARLPEVKSSTGVRAGPARVFGSSLEILATDPRHLSDLFDIGVKAGDVNKLTANGIAVSTEAASTHHLALGQPVTVTFPNSGDRTFVVQAIYRARDLAGDYFLPLQAAVRYFPSQLDFQVYVKFAPGVSASAGKAAVTAQLAQYPNAKALDRAEYKTAQLAQIDQLLNLVYGLLGLALLIALMGIANTLGLAIHERTRELGLLRAVGMTRGQLRSTIRYEAVIVAILGALEGIVAGVLLGWALVAALHDVGVSVLSVPVTPLVMFTVLAAVAGVIAAVFPGRRAARLDILAAIGSE
jgi:putative ABC transport system permease protein